MKKKYTKPFVKVERFQLDAAIAASCSSNGFIPIGKSENDCSDAGKGVKGFYFGANLCSADLTIPSDPDNLDDGICYHGPEVAKGVTFIAS